MVKWLKMNLIPEEYIICLSKCTNIITNCGNKFCQECVESWSNKIFSCPTCRNSESNLKLYSLSSTN